MKFEQVIRHLEVLERMHRSNALTARTAEETQRLEDLAEEFRAARELLNAAS